MGLLREDIAELVEKYWSDPKSKKTREQRGELIDALDELIDSISPERVSNDQMSVIIGEDEDFGNLVVKTTADGQAREVHFMEGYWSINELMFVEQKQASTDATG
jgi:hypothetical protein